MSSAFDALKVRKRAETLAASYPALLAEAERVAANVMQGEHGRRRPGQGETFWQYRTHQPSDSARAIDWRRSARSEGHYVRENEWEAANLVYLWRDGSAGMDWKSRDNLPTKQTRADILLLALGILLMRGGERCAVMGQSRSGLSGRHGLERLSQMIATASGHVDALDADVPKHARIIIASDFLEGIDVWRARLARLSGRPMKGVLVHIIDPAEREFPYKGRMEMRLPGVRPGIGKTPTLRVGRAERAKTAYQNKFAAHCDAVTQIGRRLGWPVITHETQRRATLALSTLYHALSGDMR